MLFFLPGRQIYKTAMCITSKCFNTPLCVKYFFIDRPCLGFISPTRSTRRRTAAAHLPERPQWHLPVPDSTMSGQMPYCSNAISRAFCAEIGEGKANSSSPWLVAADTALCGSNQYFAAAISYRNPSNRETDHCHSRPPSHPCFRMLGPCLWSCMWSAGAF